MRNMQRNQWPEGIELTEGDREDFAGSRLITGRLTKKRYKLIKRSLRARNRAFDEDYSHGRCGHDYDCCGCVFAEKYSMRVVGNKIVIIHFQSRNY